MRNGQKIVEMLQNIAERLSEYENVRVGRWREERAIEFGNL